MDGSFFNERVLAEPLLRGAAGKDMVMKSFSDHVFGIASLRPRSRGRIFVLGGSKSGRSVTRVEIFDVARGVWEAAPPMAAGRHAAAAAVEGRQDLPDRRDRHRRNVLQQCEGV
eukprot:1827083-Prymnesium_polylepis.1